MALGGSLFCFEFQANKSTKIHFRTGFFRRRNHLQPVLGWVGFAARPLERRPHFRTLPGRPDVLEMEVGCHACFRNIYASLWRIPSARRYK